MEYGAIKTILLPSPSRRPIVTEPSGKKRLKLLAKTLDNHELLLYT